MTQDSVVSAFRYRAFISYSHQDKAWADWLHRALETYAIPRRLVGRSTAAGVIPKRLAPIFRDRDELASAHDLGRKVNEALAQSANLIVICSPRSAGSRWVNEEVLAYKRLGRSERIFCLIVDGEPHASDIAGRQGDECFAPALRFQLDADGQPTPERTEPIAADARAGKDGKGNARLKLIAGMLEVGFDQLKQRELQRRTRRMSAIAALALAVMTLTTTLAIAAMIARRAAENARHDAERRQNQAEDLVGFMLGDLNDKLAQVSRLDIMQSVDDKAMAYFASLPASDATDAALALRVTALEKIGSVHMDQGQTPAALAAYQAASLLAAELARRSPDDPARKAAYADSLKWVGQAYWYQGDLDKALRNFRSAGALLQAAHSARPGDNGLAFNLAAARNNIGHVLQARADFAGAQVEYDATLKLYRGLAMREPANPRWQSYLGYAWDNLGRLALEQGHLDRAIEDYRVNQQIKARIVARNPAANHDAQQQLLVSNAILGRTLALCGELDAALRYTGDAVKDAKAQAAYDSANAFQQEYVALYSQQLGGLLRQAGQWDAAAAADAESLAIFGKLVARDGLNTDWQQEYAQARIETARLKLQRHDPAGAQALADAALRTLSALRRKQPSNPSLALLWAQASIALGDIAAKRNDPTEARAAWSRAHDAIAPALHTGSDPNALATAANALLRLDATDAAAPLIARLAAMGYHAPDFDTLLAAKHITYTVDADAMRRIAVATREPVTSPMNH
ncbi:MAG: toll/interleukin-1 receptor domain-containing protein [Xanthomonadaceae bacterium]|nr:toll/interleukin-1 receptor domain-containing protein [Xanthomonadaceae bacterium]